MNKATLTDKVAELTGMKKKDVSKTVDATIEAIKQSLSEGDQVRIVGFGTFEVKDRAARIGRNPQTGEEIHIEARKVPSFRAGKTLKNAIHSA